jgi:hypothetical protein
VNVAVIGLVPDIDAAVVLNPFTRYRYDIVTSVGELLAGLNTGLYVIENPVLVLVPGVIAGAGGASCIYVGTCVLPMLFTEYKMSVL